ncbi:MAG: PQQ-binding-like beta-propeller repeat protein [Verrucomicrobiae bacterium]|nr:PQQ-binding-like beta-propeller repeat protein [Verrucomicrobiae bacterium]
MRSFLTFLLFLGFIPISESAAAFPERISIQRGIVAVVDDGVMDAAQLRGLADGNELKIYVQARSRVRATALRSVHPRLIVDHDASGRIDLADNLADVVVAPAGGDEGEILRVLRPRGVAHIGGRTLTKSVPSGVDDWSHPYHGPDNNPQSGDQLARGELRTQFIGWPMFSPMPQQSVSAGGRVFKAYGHIAHKANQNAVLNTLMAVNGYNGTILWSNALPESFMIHRNTMIATDDALYLADKTSCKLYDAVTGEVRDEIRVPADIADGTVWKWMALRDGVLYALIGQTEVPIEPRPSTKEGLGHWPWDMWKGHDYSDPKTSFGFGRTLVAIDVRTRKILWHHRDEDYFDARALVMNGDSLFLYSPDKVLLRIDAKSGETVWRTADEAVLKAIGGNLLAQHYTTGYSTSCYAKCNDEYLFFAGPQRARLVSIRTKDGSVAWTHAPGNLQLVLRPDAIYAAGPQRDIGGKFDYATGKLLEEFPGRRACTRATGGVDSVFFRANGGTVRLMTGDSQAQHIDPMRPPCQDGVLIANGHFYWGPWMCGCQLSLYGNIALGPAEQQPTLSSSAASRMTAKTELADGPLDVEQLAVGPNDWPAYRGDNARSDRTDRGLPVKMKADWSARVVDDALPTAPVCVGDMVFIADRTGRVHGYGLDGQLKWTAATAGPVYYPPAIAGGRAFVGSADGRVYAYEARTGRFLWSRRVAPMARRVAVFDELISTWPVSGGVVVRDGRVYAAAGLAHYDGTHVVALDVRTGRVLASNDSSGVLGRLSNNGVSMQGNLRIEDGELRFLAGGVYEVARYDLDTLVCLNEPKEQITSQYRTAFYAYYPDYGKYLSVEYRCEDGCVLNFDASYEGSKFTSLSLEEPPASGAARPRKEEARWLLPNFSDRQKKPVTKAVWRDGENRRFTAYVISRDVLLAAGHAAAKPEEAFLVAINIRTGKDLWRLSLDSLVTKGGLAFGRDGSVFASLENGRLARFRPELK